ncbi:Uma2 family endonuclease [Prosthecobacter sp.]|uniref:Uma2 family endonuclease n=1 Tax=Prosthecobacter sp. TaxID=1965333 RepID=UPI003784D57C
MPASITHRFTVEDYYRMAETGILKPDARVELIEGEIVDMMPIGPFHAGAGSELSAFFACLAQGRWLVWNQYPLRIDEHSEPQPDLMLIRPPAKKYKQSHPTPEDVILLVEISDTTLRRDREIKLPLYAKAGIEEVWILNVPEKQIEVYREPNYLGYETKSVVRDGRLAPMAFPDAEIDVQDLLQ